MPEDDDYGFRLAMVEPLKPPDYDSYRKACEEMGQSPEKVLTCEQYSAHIAELNEQRAEKRAVILAEIKRKNHLLFRTKHHCTACGGPILHRYKRPEGAPFSLTDTLIGPGPDNYGDDASPIKPKVHDKYYCKDCRLEHHSSPPKPKK